MGAFERLGGYELESRARQILAGLGFPVERYDKPTKEFSGGWQMRISLSKLLLRRPDVLLWTNLPPPGLGICSVARGGSYRLTTERFCW